MAEQQRAEAHRSELKSVETDWGVQAENFLNKNFSPFQRA